jgi:hypothetical protein
LKILSMKIHHATPPMKNNLIHMNTTLGCISLSWRK